MAPIIGGIASLRGGAEVDTPRYDTTNISRETFDSSALLTANARNLSTARNSLSGPASAVRAASNSMLATKLAQDNQVMTQYQGLNNQSKTSFERRVTDQARYNNQQRVSTDNINAANRGALDARLQNTLSSVSNVGKGLNQKQQSAEMMRLYQVQYEDVYNRVLKTLMNG